MMRDDTIISGSVYPRLQQVQCMISLFPLHAKRSLPLEIADYFKHRVNLAMILCFNFHVILILNKGFPAELNAIFEIFFSSKNTGSGQLRKVF